MRDVASIEDPYNGIQRHPGLVRKQCRFNQNSQQIMRYFGEGDSL